MATTKKKTKKFIEVNSQIEDIMTFRITFKCLRGDLEVIEEEIQQYGEIIKTEIEVDA